MLTVRYHEPRSYSPIRQEFFCPEGKISPNELTDCGIFLLSLKIYVLM